MPTFEPSANCSNHWIAKRCCEKPRAVHKNKHTAPEFQNTPRHAIHFDHRATSLWCVCVQRSAHKQRPKQMGYNFCPHSPLFGVCSHEFGQPRLVAIFRMLNTQMNYAAEYVCQVRGDGDVTVGWLAGWLLAVAIDAKEASNVRRQRIAPSYKYILNRNTLVITRKSHTKSIKFLDKHTCTSHLMHFMRGVKSNCVTHARIRTFV